jgi:hypothetical protein
VDLPLAVVQAAIDGLYELSVISVPPCPDPPDGIASLPAMKATWRARESRAELHVELGRLREKLHDSLLPNDHVGLWSYAAKHGRKELRDYISRTLQQYETDRRNGYLWPEPSIGVRDPPFLELNPGPYYPPGFKPPAATPAPANNPHNPHPPVSRLDIINGKIDAFIIRRQGNRPTLPRLDIEGNAFKIFREELNAEGLDATVSDVRKRYNDEIHRHRHGKGGRRSRRPET